MEDRGIGIVGVVVISALEEKVLGRRSQWHLIGKRAVCALSDISTVLSAASRHPLVNQRMPKECSHRLSLKEIPLIAKINRVDDSDDL